MEVISLASRSDGSWWRYYAAKWRCRRVRRPVGCWADGSRIAFVGRSIGGGRGLSVRPAVGDSVARAAVGVKRGRSRVRLQLVNYRGNSPVAGCANIVVLNRRRRMHSRIVRDGRVSDYWCRTMV